MPDKNLRDEIAGLTEAVHELRDREIAVTLRELRAEVEKLRAERAAHQCHCMHVYWQPYTYTVPGTVTYPVYTVTSGNPPSGYSGTVASTPGITN